MKQTCPWCGVEFDPKKAYPNANRGALSQVIYCSEECKRASQNIRHFLRKKSIFNNDEDEDES